MKVVIGGVTYYKVKNVSFEPEMDLSLNSIPVNEFMLDIVTDSTILADQYATLYDDRDNIWAKYWITSAEKTGENLISITAKSPLYFLDFWGNMPESININTTFENLLDSIAMGIPVDFEYTIASSLKTKTIGNYFPEETPRERLHKACFTIGAYMRSFFSDKLQFIKLSSTITQIPLNKTFWQPVVERSDYVTAVSVKSYVYNSQGEKTSESDNVLQNSNAPARVMTNIVSVDGVSFVNSNNVSDILQRMGDYYFPNRTCELDVINNADYKPGQKVKFYINDTDMLVGYIQKCIFQFGLQARSTLLVVMIEDVS